MVSPVPLNTPQDELQPLLRETPAGQPYPVHALGPLQRAFKALVQRREVALERA